MSIEQYKQQHKEDIDFYIKCFGQVGQDMIDKCETIEELCHYLGHL
jgi:hypothetical protein